VRIDKNKFFGSYEFNWKLFYGEFFDYRLIKKNLDWVEFKNNIKNAFKKISDKIWKTKFFIWIDEKILSSINRDEFWFLDNYETERVLKSDKFKDIFLDRDWIIIVKSLWWRDKQIEKVFTEDEVEKRLWLYMNYLNGYATECWAPCRSRELEWKPCEIKTYRGNCHYHR
jgi:hypothetical protein